MVTVVLYGITGIFAAAEIKEFLLPYGFISVSGNSVEQTGENCEFLITEFSTRASIKLKKGIIVMLGEITESCYLKIPDNFIGIVRSSDINALKLLKKCKIKTICCGMSVSDTVILSSITENTANVCLQRKITTLLGTTVEPQEFRVKLKRKISDYALTAGITLLLLAGIVPDEFEF